VVRIEVLGCSESGIGTGFLLSPTLVATVNHVIADALVVSLIDGDQRTTGRVIGVDPQRDLALVESSTPLAGYHFDFAGASPQIGDRVAAIGFPIGDPITMTQGGVSGLNRTVTVDGQTRGGLIETDAALNPGNSGGPLLAADGTVLGLVDAKNVDATGIAYAVPASQAQPLMLGWQQSPSPVAAGSCSNPLGPLQATTTLPTIPGLSSEASTGITTAFDAYFNGINSGDYRSAWQVLSPRLRAGSSLNSFAKGDSTSYDFDQVVLHARQVDGSTAKVAIQFTSLQTADKGPNGDTCDVWTLVYTMIDGGGGAWYIDATAPYRGTSHTSC
jgi:hypothetical protein